jgi:hypothetical protein
MDYYIGIEAKPILLEIPDFEKFLLSAAPPILTQENITFMKIRKMQMQLLNC